MTRASKRKSDLQSSPSAKTARVDSTRSASSKAKSKGNERIDELYTKYANKLSGMIDPEGIEALCSDLEVDYTDVRILMLAWFIPFQFHPLAIMVIDIWCLFWVIHFCALSQDEWRRGLKALRVDTINKLKKTLPELEKEVLKSENFEDFYKYAFHYCLTEEKQKCLDIESTCILIDMVLSFQYQPQVDSFIKFLKIQSDYKISFPDLQNYDTCEAWPLLLDNFVDWLKTKANVASA
ncbi:hypothetical protein DH2020_010829 [Rehmannia glutinosa]|uniref:Defective in cullin neddylation protein n=1 Tax=Rehmannia glutinosa TaxID=99300 RepID=A0ABR0XBT3_REHGL